MIRSQTFLVLLFLALRTAVADDSIVSPAADTHDYVAGKLITLNDNGGWSWFMDERVIVADGKLIVGSVRSVKDFNSGKPDPNWGNVEVSALDLASGTVGSVVLDTHFEQDDHDGPAFLPLQDGRLLAVYTRHGVERKVFYRQSAPHDPLTWGERHEFDSPGVTPPYRQDTVTYSNLYRVGSGRIYNFYRGVDHDPNYMFSDDDGSTWTYGGRMMMGRNGYSPYMKYVQAGLVVPSIQLRRRAVHVQIDHGIRRRCKMRHVGQRWMHFLRTAGCNRSTARHRRTTGQRSQRQAAQS